MVGDGSRIGGPPGMPPRVGPETPASAAKEPSAPKSSERPPSDSFIKGEARPRVDHGPQGKAPVPLGREASGSTDLLRLARDNPLAARQLVGALAGQAAATLSEIEKASIAARQVLEQLAQERFAKSAREKKADELRRQREKLQALKLRHAMAQRKMALLQQIAGKLGDPRLDQELDRILSHHKKLKTAWGKRHHLLDIGDTLFGDLPDTPEHLQQVIKAEVRAGTHGDEAAELLGEISPRAVIAELIARTLDGSTRPAAEVAAGARRGELGRAAQSYALFGDLLAQALADDPLGED